MSEQAPPDNLDLEDSVLGAVILSPERLDTVREHVNSTAFASLPHRYTFAAIESLRDQGRPIDILILKEELDRRGHLEDVGGQSFISDLTSRVPTSVNVVYYARILEEKYKRRQLSEYGTAVHNAANNGMEDADVVALAQERLEDILSYKTPTLRFEDLSTWRDAAAKPVSWVFNEVLPASICACIAAPGGVGKSMLLLGLAVSAATGEALLPSFVPAKPMRVLAIFGEDSFEHVARRLRSIGRLFSGDLTPDRLDYDLQNNIRLLCGTAHGLVTVNDGKVSTTPFYKELERQSAWADLIILDPLSKFHGLPSENDNALASQLMNKLADLTKANGATIIFAHHVNKESQRDKNIASQAAPRGASAFIDESRWAATLQVFSEDEAKRFEIPLEESWRYLSLNIVKDNYSENSHRPIHLKRFNGGALGEVDISKLRLRRIVMIIREYIENTDEPLLKTDVTEHSKKGAGKAIQDLIKEEMGSAANRRDLRDAIDFGLMQGLISIRQDGLHKYIEIPDEEADEEDTF